MATIITTSITIHASPQTVWAHLMNPDELKHWLTGFVSYKPLTGTVGAPGSTSQLIFQERGKEVMVTETVLLSIPNQQFTSRMVSSAFSTENDIRLVPSGANTELVQTVHFTPHGFFMKLLAPMIKGMMKKRTIEEFGRFKGLVERTLKQ